MRITVVSAHHPPNFVSGGTLQPQRLARGLLARGHDVRVFAGHLDADRTPLETWTDLDEVGLPVHWIVSTPFMGWSDPLNFDNPAVAERFSEHLSAHPADVVHLHALQTLGAGLVGVAKASGAAVVVTMHDFWWICPRQFLVDRTGRPCSLVVDAGACACEAGRAHLEARTRRLADLLEPADLVLAPSRTACEVLAANGVAPGRLEVDENGIDLQPLAPSSAPVGRDGPVVVRYTGGSNAMKGAEVLLEAATLLGRRSDLRVLAHGIGEAVERVDHDLGATVVEALPPYPPEDLDAVLAASDVLVLPSVMRESHSLVTREALLRGVPVVATDTLGPEEVVEDGRNGLVVPAADAALLADALERVTDRHLLARLRAGAADPPPVRATDDQVAGLERRFESLRRGRDRHGPTGTEGLHRVLFVVGIDGAPLRYRAQLPAEALALRGVEADVRHYRDPDVAALAQDADVVVVYRVPATRQVLELLEHLRGGGVPVAFDVDDLIFDPDIAREIPALRLLPPDEAALWLDGVRRYRTTMEACDAYIGSTPQLVEHARAVVGIDAHLFENGVGRALGAASEVASARPRRPGPPRLGYFSGTTTHDDDWRSIEPAVVEVLEQQPDVELWLGGHLRPTEAVAALGPRLRRIPFTPWSALPDVLRDLDVNLAPLEPGSRFNDAKSAIKWLEAALVGVPTIASPSAPFVDAIDDGRTGWLADGHDGWATALERALGAEHDRRLVGARAQRSALLRWSPHLQADRYVAVLQAVRHQQGDPRRPSPAWTPVAPEEPWSASPTPLTPYPPGPAPTGPEPPPVAPPSLTPRIRAKARLARERVRAEGVVATGQAALRWARRRAAGPRR